MARAEDLGLTIWTEKDLIAALSDSGTGDESKGASQSTKKSKKPEAPSDEPKPKKAKATKTNPFANKKFCITGSLKCKTRGQLETMIFEVLQS